jgi:hypothetical protein
MKFDWVTDSHLDHCSKETITELVSRLWFSDANGIFLTGDIANAHTLETFLLKLAGIRIVYYGLGNHDYYGGSFSLVRSTVLDIDQSSPSKERNPCLVYLQIHDWIDLTPNTYLIGVDGWGDAQYGLGEDTPLGLNDFRLIDDFKRSSNKIRLCQSLGAEAAFLLKDKLEKILAYEKDNPVRDNIVILTHVPPFEENAHLIVPMNGPDLCGFFGCKAIGDLLLKFCQDNPRKNVTVYSGHVHQATDYSPLPNLRAITATAEYGKPFVTTLEIP